MSEHSGRTISPGGDTDGERVDAARNRRLLLSAAMELVAEHGVDAVTMDAVATRAGVGKGTLFRRFGSRAGLMLALLDQSEADLQHRFLFGDPPLGPGADPVTRLIAFGQARLDLVDVEGDVLRAAEQVTSSTSKVTCYAQPSRSETLGSPLRRGRCIWCTSPHCCVALGCRPTSS